jgi:hypothetical protein
LGNGPDAFVPLKPPELAVRPAKINPIGANLAVAGT